MKPKEEERPEPEQVPVNRRNIVIMIILALMFIVGIIIRWDYISKEAGESIGRYFEPADTTETTK